MLRGLNIRNMLLIDKLDLEFQAGLNVLTGETGAGKSILLDSLGFVLGWRGRADMVRKGADLGEVSAWFELNATHPVRDILREAGLPNEDDLLLRRTNTPDGRKTAYVNDRRCTGEILRQLSDCLVELHGQHDDRGLLDSKGHRALLDSYAGIDLSEVRSAWKKLAKLTKDINASKLALEVAERDAEYIRYAVGELAELSPDVGEDESLDARRRLMQSGARIREDIGKAAQALGSDGAENMLSDANRWLEETANDAEGRLDEPLAALSRAMNEVADAQRGIEDCLSQLDFDPMELERIEERLFAIRALARKHKVLPDELPALATDLTVKLNAIDTGASNIADLAQERDQAQIVYDKCAAALFDQRIKSGAELDKRMMQELAPLKMEAAIFKTDVVVTDAGPDGADNVAFTVSTNPGAPSGPINKIASGGELSRFLLALKVCLTSRSDGLTLIFDEIDRGVGGATADAVGRRLAALSSKGQVLVVTHSPQVAALGAHQWQVLKTTDGQETISSVIKLTDDERTDEIARMLAGDVITDEARAAAKSLLNAQ